MSPPRSPSLEQALWQGPCHLAISPRSHPTRPSPPPHCLPPPTPGWHPPAALCGRPSLGPPPRRGRGGACCEEQQGGIGPGTGRALRGGGHEEAEEAGRWDGPSLHTLRGVQLKAHGNTSEGPLQATTLMHELPNPLLRPAVPAKARPQIRHLDTFLLSSCPIHPLCLPGSHCWCSRHCVDGL